MRRDPLAFLTRIAREHGDVARFRMGPVELHLVNRPEWIRDVLVTHAASFHKGRGLERAKRLLGEGLLTSEDPVHLRQQIGRAHLNSSHRLLSRMPSSA